jgi:hypothetical protein
VQEKKVESDSCNERNRHFKRTTYINVFNILICFKGGVTLVFSISEIIGLKLFSIFSLFFSAQFSRNYENATGKVGKDCGCLKYLRSVWLCKGKIYSYNNAVILKSPTKFLNFKCLLALKVHASYRLHVACRVLANEIILSTWARKTLQWFAKSG